jgi:short-subunit dehydrogenase
LQEELNNNNQTILITGASGDLGIEIVKQSINKNWNVIALTKNKTKLKQRLSLKEYNKITVYEVDLSKVKSTKDFSFLKKHCFNYIVLNAGILIKKDFNKLTVIDIESQFNVNFTSNLLLLQTLVPGNINKNDNHIIAIGSMSGVENSLKFKQMTIYGASKAALHNLIQTLAVEYKDSHIIFNALAFGAIQTNMLRKAFGDQVEAISTQNASNFIINFLISANKVSNGNILNITKSNI